LFGQAFGANNFARQGNFNGVAMPVQVFALAGVIGNAMPRIKF
jgi:hypothetical protein